MTFESIKEDINNSLGSLLTHAKDCSWNTISPNIGFIVSDFNEFKGANSFERSMSRNKVNNSKKLLSLESAVEMLKKEYDDLYDINLYIFRAFRNETIIEIQYYRKSNFEPDYFETVKDSQPMLHAKIALPSYASEGGKFDVNWESGGGFRHAWKSFLYQFKYKRMMKELKR
ncbi:hypothetical protein [Chryseobacterium sp. 2987]|uniref:hypothetical protein n=1 Tax=Chryseobacterium sp. 2987 TaxID=2817767 RepID=UPI0028602565|nr:hypothetical protein [Chryseobacterium sp. 2987]MDR6922314.1 hypothetical protein [Chryseobacterium sp. 2987]